MDVLQLDVSGRPQAWISAREAAVLYASDGVAWTLGEACLVMRGGVQRRTGLQTAVSFGGGRRGRIGRQEFLVFNQELATLLKAGMPLVQSLDILRQRVSNLTFGGPDMDVVYATCGDRVYSRKVKVKGANAFEAPFTPAKPRL